MPPVPVTAELNQESETANLQNQSRRYWLLYPTIVSTIHHSKYVP